VWAIRAERARVRRDPRGDHTSRPEGGLRTPARRSTCVPGARSAFGAGAGSRTATPWTCEAPRSEYAVNASASPKLCIQVEVYRDRTGGQVGRAIEGEAAAALPRHDIEAMYRTSAPQLARAIYAYVGGRRHLAEDAVAEAFARALEHVEEIRAPLPWIYATAFRIAGRELRRERRPVPEMPDPVPGTDPLEIRDILEALATLTLNQRAAVVLHDQEGMTAPEVARLLGMSAATVRVHVFRGRKRLRRLLGAEDEADA
jgi:RNA polymerase sigma factor (sigma-70 family)